MNDAETTPIDHPLLADIRAVKRVLNNVETVQLAMFEEFKGFRDRMRLALATCIGCALISLASAVVTVIARVAP